jgi:hypothetical protein
VSLQQHTGNTVTIVDTDGFGGHYVVHEAVGTVAHGTADSGNPIKVGGFAKATNPPGVSDGQRVNAWYGQFGQQMVGLTTAGTIADGTANVGATMSAGGASHILAVSGLLFNGANHDRPRTPLVFKTIAAVAVTAGTPAAFWTPTAGKKFRLMGFMLSLSVAGSVILKDAATEMIRTPLMAAGVGLAAPPLGNGILSALANNVLNGDVTATGSVSGFVFGTEE